MSFRLSRTGRKLARLPARVLALAAALTISLTSTHATIGVAYQMLLGNPTGATADTNNHTHYLIQRAVQALDYNDTLRQPNWTSWHYTTNDSGSASRSSVFFVDTNLPANFYRVLTSDLSGSGYDRGHMCPSADRTDTDANNDATFYMSNIIPQAPDNNQGIWANLENYSRAIAASNEVLVLCGPQGFGTNKTASAGQIPIASNVWKIIVAVPLGAGSTLSRITNSTRVIAANIPNIQGIYSDPWQNYLTSVNHLQTNTGFTFFTTLNSNLAAVLRAKVDGSPACGITNFTPASGAVASSVVLRGTNFTGVTAVQFNGVSATFTVNSANQITATVPANASTGPLAVIAAGGTATTASPFTVESAKVPALPPTLTAVTLTGNQFQFTVNGSVGTNYIVQVATNFATPVWLPAVTNAAPFLFTVPNADQSPSRLYRALVAP